MAASSVLWALALGVTLVFTDAQCPGGSFTATTTKACCDNSINTGVLFGNPKCCRTSDGMTCYCDPNAELVGEGCEVTGQPTTTTTAAPTTTVDMNAPPADTTAAGGNTATTTAAGGGDVSTTAAAASAEPTTTETPTTTPEPLCPVPGPVGRILNAAPIPRCEENGVVGFSAIIPGAGPDPILLCHGVLAYNSSSMMRELWMSEYCWTQVRSSYKGGVTVFGTLLGEQFDGNDCFLGEAVVNDVGIAKIQLPSIMQWYLDAIGTEMGCRSIACIPEESFRPRITYNNCYIAGYGTTTVPTTAVLMDGMVKRANVTVEFRASQCGTVDSGPSYTQNNADRFCFISRDGAANCKLADAGSPVFCYTDTMEPVLAAFTVPNTACDDTIPSFPSDLV